MRGQHHLKTAIAIALLAGLPDVFGKKEDKQDEVVVKEKEDESEKDVEKDSPTTAPLPCVSSVQELMMEVNDAVDGADVVLCEGTLSFTSDEEFLKVTAEGVDLKCIVSGVEGACVLDGGKGSRIGPILIVEAQEFAVFDITFQNTQTSSGAAISIRAPEPEGSASYLLDNCSFVNNQVDGVGAGAVDIAGPQCTDCSAVTTAVLKNCNFIENTASSKDSFAGALSAYDLDKASLIECVFSGNRAPINESGAASLSEIDFVEVIESIFTDNHAGIFAGALTLYDLGIVSVFESTFAGNTAGTWGGAIDAELVDALEIRGCTFDSNQDLCDNCEEGGAAVGTENVGEIKVGTTTFVNNNARGWGAAMCIATSDTVTVEKCDFESNVAQGGGAIYAYLVGQLTLQTSLYKDNAATSDCGGGIELEEVAATLITGNCFEANVAPDGGAGCSYDNKKTVTLGNNTAASNKGKCTDFSFDGKCTLFVAADACLA